MLYRQEIIITAIDHFIIIVPRSKELRVADTQTTWKYRFQQEEKYLYSRHEAERLVILVQGFITKKMVTSRLALRELR